MQMRVKGSPLWSGLNGILADGERQKERRLQMARVLWLTVALVSTTLFLASLPPYYESLVTFTAPIQHAPQALHSGLAQLGIPVSVYAGFAITVVLLIYISFTAISLLIFWQRQHDYTAWLFALVLLLFGAIWPNTLNALAPSNAIVVFLSNLLNVAGFVGFYMLFYLFPDGRFVPRWTLITTVAILLLAIANTFFPGSPFDPSSWPPVVNVVVSLGIAASLIFAQVYRYAYVSSPLQRQQTKWVTLSMVITIVSLAATSVLEGVPQLHVTSGADALFGIVSFVTYGLVFISVPFAICIALLRYHLWDVDIIINRTLVYATFTVILTTIWVTLTTVINQTAQYLFGGSSAVIATVLPTVTILTIFQPLRTTLEQWVNRRFYPSNLEMTRDFVEFSLASLEVSEVTDLIVRRVCQLLQCEYGAIFLGSGDADFKVISTWKIDADGLAAMSLPLTIHDRWGRAKVVQQPADTLFVILAPLYIPRLRKEEVRGILALGPRAADRGYSWDDRRGLIRFGEEAGKKIYASQLAAAKVKT